MTDTAPLPDLSDWHSPDRKSITEMLRSHAAAVSAADNAALRAENEQLRRRIEVPTIDRGSQNWKALDGATAFHLIERHADGWADVAQMMDEWLEARTDTLSKRVEELEAASLFRDADDPERGCSSIEEVIAEYDPGVIVKINRAARLPDITIRTLPVADDASYAEYEVIPSQPKEPTPCA